MHREAGRPWPVICAEDDVVDYMILEAVALRVRAEDREAQKEQQVRDWKEEKRKDLKRFI